MRIAHASASRSGMSLLEVMAALTVFLMSLVAIGRLMTLATEQAMLVSWQSRATMLAESKMAEFSAGILTLTGTSSGTFDEDPTWNWEAEIAADATMTMLYRVTMTAWKQSKDGSKVSTTISQYIYEPTARGSLESPAATTSSTTSSSSSSSSSSSTGGTTTP
jgi:Tfp pilus assembly protein PilV